MDWRRRPLFSIFGSFLFMFIMSYLYIIVRVYLADKAEMDEDIVSVPPLPKKNAHDFPVCDSAYMDVVPCLGRSTFTEECTPDGWMIDCLVPAPRGYRVPVKWPRSISNVWKANVISINAASDSDVLTFEGQESYDIVIQKVLEHNGNATIKAALDLSCTIGGSLIEKFHILTMSTTDAFDEDLDVKIALERGIPAMLTALSTRRLPYPSNSFDLIHCSNCTIEWTEVLLRELDRLLKPGGYFVWCGSIGVQTMSQLVEETLCWDSADNDGDTIIWKKPTSSQCTANPPACTPEVDPDDAWGVPLQNCGAGGIATDDRSKRLQMNESYFKQYRTAWSERLLVYWKSLETQLDDKKSLRNVLDMNAELGGLAVALRKKMVWVMNVVPKDGRNTLGFLYDRGLIGTLHDWCEAFPSYPRTYDLIHASMILSQTGTKCDLEDRLLEMDRLLRPMGIVIVRDAPDTVAQVKERLSYLHWDAWFDEIEESSHSKILLARKQFWQPDDAREAVP